MKQKTLLLAFFMLAGFIVQAQQKITGTVISGEDGMPIPGVSVYVKGNQMVGTATNIDGHYTLSVPNDASTLVFTFVGMKDQEVLIEGRSTIDVTMESAALEMDEVVVIGYGQKKKNEFTGSVIQVNTEKLSQVPAASVESTLQGNVAGLQSVAPSGQPGAAQQIRIRGIGSINASNAPLYVIDGVPVVSGDFTRSATTANVMASLNSNDIKSVTVLKDASATSVYGARGANGVIVITTKSGQKGDTKFNFDAEYGMNDLAVEGPKPLNAENWWMLYKEGWANYLGMDEISDEQVIPFLQNNGLPTWDQKTNTDWSKEVLRDQAIQQQYNFSARGGGDKTNFFISAGMFDQESIVKNSDFKRYNGLVNLKHIVSDKVVFKTNTNASYSEQKTLSDGGGFANPMMAKYFLLAADKAYDENGDPYIPEGGRMMNGIFNPVYMLEYDHQKSNTTKVFNTSQVEYKPIEGMRFTSKLGLDYISIDEQNYQNPVHGDGRTVQGRSQNYYTRNFNWVWQNMLDYGFNVSNDHRIDIKLLYESQKNSLRALTSSAERVAGLNLYNLNTFAKPLTTAGYETSWQAASTMANVNYAFQRKLFLDATYRREGNSRFAEDNKYGHFWSVGAGYLLSKEDFIKELGFISNLKLRTSYGVNGNAGISNNAWLSLLGFSNSYADYPVIYYTGIQNNQLTWEQNKPFNIGLDFGLFNNRISGTIEYYKRTTSDLLLDLPLSLTSGFDAKTMNIGEMENSGMELSLSTVNFDGDFRWTTDINMTTVNNEVTELDKNADGNFKPIISGSKRINVGSHIRTYYMRKWAGVDPDNGDPLWYINGKDGETTNDYAEAQRAEQGQSTPDIYGGITNTFSYKGISLSFQFNYALGYKVLDAWAPYMLADGRNYFTYGGYEKMLDRWQKPGDQTDVPKIVAGNDTKSYEVSTRYLYDADHIRLRNLTLGYDLPKKLLANIGVDKMRVYVRGTNLWTYVFDEDLKWDPETQENGILDLTLPPMKTVSFGINVNF